MAKKAPGKSDREGLTLVQLMDMFPDETAAIEWLEAVVWDGERHYGKCGSARTKDVPNAKPMPYLCTDCRSCFSVRTGTPIARSNVPLRKWAIAIYLCMLHCIREAWAPENGVHFGGPVEVDETYFGGKRKNMSKEKRNELIDTGRGPIGKTAVVGMKDRDSNMVTAQVVEDTDAITLQGFVTDNAPRHQGLHGRSWFLQRHDL